MLHLNHLLSVTMFSKWNLFQVRQKIWGKLGRVRKRELIDNQFFPLSAVVCHAWLRALRALHQTGKSKADRGKKWLSINSRYLTLPSGVVFLHFDIAIFQKCLHILNGLKIILDKKFQKSGTRTKYFSKSIMFTNKRAMIIFMQSRVFR